MLKVILWVYIRFTWKGWSYKLWRGSFDWKLKVLFCFLRVKSYRRGTRLPPLFSPNESDQNIQISIFFKADQRSDNRNSWVDSTLPEPGCTCKCCTLGHVSIYRRGGRINFWGGSFDRKLKVLVLVLRVRSDWKATSSYLHAFFSPNASRLTLFGKDSWKLR